MFVISLMTLKINLKPDMTIRHTWCIVMDVELELKFKMFLFFVYENKIHTCILYYICLTILYFTYNGVKRFFF